MNLPRVEGILEEHKNKVRLLHVYIREAHAADAWQLDSNKTDDVCYMTPKRLEQRLDIAKDMLSNIELKYPLICDLMDDNCSTAYEAIPERLYIIDVETETMIWRCGIGPFCYDLSGLRATLASLPSKPTVPSGLRNEGVVEVTLPNADH
eukprot:Clim_evm58s210 gene=Clim_evmTU58s210